MRRGVGGVEGVVVVVVVVVGSGWCSAKFGHVCDVILVRPKCGPVQCHAEKKENYAGLIKFDHRGDALDGDHFFIRSIQAET